MLFDGPDWLCAVVVVLLGVDLATGLVSFSSPSESSSNSLLAWAWILLRALVVELPRLGGSLSRPTGLVSLASLPGCRRATVR